MKYIIEDILRVLAVIVGSTILLAIGVTLFVWLWWIFVPLFVFFGAVALVGWGLGR